MIWRFVAVALFGVTSIADPVTATGAAVLATAALWISFTRSHLDVSPVLGRIATAVLALMLVHCGSPARWQRPC